jgi:hypothetical protein
MAIFGSNLSTANRFHLQRILLLSLALPIDHGMGHLLQPSATVFSNPSTALPNNSHPGRWQAHAHRIVRESPMLHLSRPMPTTPLLGKLPAGFWSTLTADLEDFLPNNSLLSCNSSSRGDRLDAQRIKP